MALIYPNDTMYWLQHSARWIWETRGKAKQFGFPFSEETITETVLLDLAVRLPHVLQIVPFNKWYEGKIGADWEWCLYDAVGSRYLRFLVQAKLLDVDDKLYAHIDRYIGQSKVKQIERLRETAQRRGIPAIYAFYNHLSDVKRIPTYDDCKYCRVDLPYSWGASVTPLNAVQAILPDKSFDRLKNVSLPWGCLVCPMQSDAPSYDLINNALHALKRLYLLARDQRIVDSAPLLDAPDRDPPNYLRPIRETLSERSDTADLEALREKLSADNPGVDGVVLIDVARDADDTPSDGD